MPTTPKRKAAIERAAEILRQLKDVPCHDCGERYQHWQMEFDHARGIKNFNISSSVCWLFVHSNPEVREQRQRQLTDELEKCDVVCCNCHANRTHLRGVTGRRKQKRERFAPFGADPKGRKLWGREKRAKRTVPPLPPCICPSAMAPANPNCPRCCRGVDDD